MFGIDEIIARQKMKDIHAEIERNQMCSQVKKAKKQSTPPFWMVLMTLLHLRKGK
jgi:hypothetical protein